MPPVLPNHDKETFKNIETTFDSDGNIKAKPKKSSLLPKILSVVAAIALWLYVFQAVEEERTFREIPIVVENFNTNLGLDVVSGYENTLDVTVSGSKSVINEITSANIRASVDLSGVTERGTYVADVNLDVPASVKITDKSVTQLRISVDKTVEKTLPLTPVLNYTIQYPYELGETVLSADTVRLTGPETDINSVMRAEVRLTLGNVRNNIVSNAEIVLYDENNYEIQSKYILLEPESVQVTVPVYKTVLFGVQPDIVLDRDRFEYSVSPSTLYLKGAVNDVEAQTMLRTERAYYNAAGEYTLGLLLPDGVSAYTSYASVGESPVQTVTLTVTEKPLPPATDDGQSGGENAE